MQIREGGGAVWTTDSSARCPVGAVSAGGRGGAWLPGPRLLCWGECQLGKPFGKTAQRPHENLAVTCRPALPCHSKFCPEARICVRGWTRESVHGRARDRSAVDWSHSGMLHRSRGTDDRDMHPYLDLSQITLWQASPRTAV